MRLLGSRDCDRCAKLPLIQLSTSLRTYLDPLSLQRYWCRIILPNLRHISSGPFVTNLVFDMCACHLSFWRRIVPSGLCVISRELWSPTIPILTFPGMDSIQLNMKLFSILPTNYYYSTMYINHPLSKAINKFSAKLHQDLLVSSGIYVTLERVERGFPKGPHNANQAIIIWVNILTKYLCIFVINVPIVLYIVIIFLFFFPQKGLA